MKCTYHSEWAPLQYLHLPKACIIKSAVSLVTCGDCPEMEILIMFWLFVLALFGSFLWSRRRLYIFASQVQGPWAWPLVGNGLKFICKNEELLSNFINIIEQNDSPMRLWMGPKLIIIVKDPNQLQIILQSSKIATKAFLYSFLEPFLGKGLFTASGPYHKHQRKLLQPLFAQRIIEGYSHLFQKHANKFVEQLREHVDGPEFDISSYLHDSAFESTMDLLLEDKNDHSMDYKEVPKFVKRFYDIVFTRVTSFWLHFDFIYKMSSYYKEQMMMKKLALTMISEIMDTRVVEVRRKLQNVDNFPESGDVRTPSMLELLNVMVQEDPNCITDAQSVDHLMTFMATSQDTQSSAIAFTLMMLGAYPHSQDLVIQELEEVLGGRKTLDLSDVSKLKYLDMCIKESMRLYPVAPFIFRDTTEDFHLEKLTIPEGVTVALSIYHAHRDPRYWEKPDEFYPDHFLPEPVNQRHPYAFIPFSAGPRRCIAQQYSYTNMKILISTILLNYELNCSRKVEDIKLTTDISIRPVDGYMIGVKQRM